MSDPILGHNQSLDTLANEVNGTFTAIERGEKKLDDLRLRVCLILDQAKKRIDAGEGGVKWEKWCDDHIHKSAGYVRECIRIARSSNPAETLKRERQESAERAQAGRDRAAGAAQDRANADALREAEEKIRRENAARTEEAEVIRRANAAAAAANQAEVRTSAEPEPEPEPQPPQPGNVPGTWHDALPMFRELLARINAINVDGAGLDGEEGRKAWAANDETYNDRMCLAGDICESLAIEFEEAWRANWKRQHPDEEELPEGAVHPKVTAALETYRATMKKFSPEMRDQFLNTLRLVKREPQDRRSKFERWSDCVNELQELQSEMEESINNIDENPEFLDPDGDKRERYQSYVDIDLSQIEGDAE